MQPTAKAIAFFKENGWTDDNLIAAGYVADGQPTDKILEGLRAANWSDDLLLQHELATQPGSQIKPDERVQRYLDLRAEKEALAKRQKEAEKPIKDEMSTIEQELGGVLTQTGSTSMKSEFGTFFFVDKQYVTMAEHEAFLRWFAADIVNTLNEANLIRDGDNVSVDVATDAALEASAFAFLTKAVAKDTVVQYIKDKGTPPPGIKYETAQEVQVRRASGK